MIQVEQDILLPPLGNCLQACVASFLELPLEQVPNFAQWFDEPDALWYRNFQRFFVARGYIPLSYLVESDPTWVPDGYSFLAAESPRGPWLHSVVALNGQPVWDPHPLRDMGLGAWKEWTWLLPLDVLNKSYWKPMHQVIRDTLQLLKEK